MDKLSQKTKRRNDILGAALDVFANKGYHASGIDDIAGKLNMGHGTFYSYFKNKLDIFNAITDQIILEISAVVVVESPNSSRNREEYREQFHRIGRRLFQLFTGDERIGVVVFYEAMGVNDELMDKMLGARAMLANFLEQYIKNGIEKKFLSPEIDTEIMAPILSAMIVEGVKEVLITKENKEALSERWIESLISLVLNGMANKQN